MEYGCRHDDDYPAVLAACPTDIRRMSSGNDEENPDDDYSIAVLMLAIQPSWLYAVRVVTETW